MLTFDESRHEYRFGGSLVPGVTSILEPLIDFSRVPREVLERKRDLGSRVHEACHYWDEDDLEMESVEADVEPYLEAWRRFRAETQCEILACEQRVYEPAMRYAGTLDRVIVYRGFKWLVDLKTAFSTPHSAGPQTAAYLRALRDPSVTHRAALLLRADGAYKFDHLTDPNDMAAFMACLQIFRFKESHRD